MTQHLITGILICGPEVLCPQGWVPSIRQQVIAAEEGGVDQELMDPVVAGHDAPTLAGGLVVEDAPVRAPGHHALAGWTADPIQEVVAEVL